ncbi:MAG: carboxypeptidase [Flaviaesturariibacter sp.]|nr:carboxypeptidase [Flaviaesturariibacter sp.]
MQKIADVKSANAVLQWDQETYMPPKGASFRGQQISTLSEIAHQMFSDPSLSELLTELSGRQDLSEDQSRNVELTLEDYTKNKKYSSAFVRQMSEQINKTFHSWIEARKQNAFAVYEKDLDALVQLKKEEAEILGYEKHPYNALLDEFEKGATVEMLDKTFGDLLPKLKTILEKINIAVPVDDSFLRQHFPKDKQWNWGMYLIKELGFDFKAGRQDISEHPFSTSFSAKDVRITTRIDEADFGNMTWSCIHETGHALYEQGLLEENYGLPLGEACSYSLHESQSRLWENNVGRSERFWEHYFPKLKAHFPEQFGEVDLLTFYKGINKVAPSLVRTEADEITYHFHVFIRYELEKNLIEGLLTTKDIPAYWNEQYKKWLGVTVPDDKRGCLQDVHWSHGSFGYFPTYSLGSFYAAQFYAQAKKEIPNLENLIKTGDSSTLLSWLRKNIHPFGRKYSSEKLCHKVTAQSLSVEYFLNYVRHKYGSIYRIT